MPGDSRFKLDPNSRGGGVIGGYSSADAIGADNPTLIVARFDPTTGRLLVDSNTGGTPVKDNEAVDADDYGTLLLGTDGSNYQVVSVNSSGRLQVDIVSGGGGGTQYTEGDTDASITGTAMLMEGAANTLLPVQGTVADGLLVNLGSNNDVVVSATDLDIRNLVFATDKVDVSGSSSVGVTGTFWQATQPVSIAQDVMLGTDFSDVLGTASLILGTQADDIANTVDGLQTSSFLYVFDGTTWDRLRGDSSNGMLVNLGSNNDVTVTSGNIIVTNAGTFAVQDSQDVMLGTDFSNVFGTGSLLITTQADNIANTQDTIATSAFLYGYDGSTWDRIQGDSTNGLLVNLGSNNDVVNSGTFVVQENGSALTALQLIDDMIYADDGNGFTVGTSKVAVVGFLADETSTDSVNEGDVGAARMTLDRKQIMTIAPSATTEGWDSFNATSGDTYTALTNSAQAVKASAGKLGGWYIYNPNSSAAYVVIYNIAAASVTVGTSTAKLILCIPATSAANLEMVNGIYFDTAISVAAATTGGGNTAPSTALECMLFYK